MRKPPELDKHPITFADAFHNGLFRAICCYVVDGDTADFFIDLGLFNYAYESLRFEGIDTPELIGTTGEERQRAIAAKLRVESLILKQPVLLETYKERTSFDRFIGRIFFFPPDSLELDVPSRLLFLEGGDSLPLICISDVLIAEGFRKQETLSS